MQHFAPRWGLIPAGTQLDRLHGEALDSPSWILDLDMYTDVSGDFDVDGLTLTAGQYAEHVHRFFRWAVMPELLRRCGGDV